MLLRQWNLPIAGRFDICFSKLQAVDVAYKSDGNQNILLQGYRSADSGTYNDIDTLKVGNTNGLFVAQRLSIKNAAATGVGSLAFKHIAGIPTVFYDYVVLHFNENELAGLPKSGIATFSVDCQSAGGCSTLRHNASEEVKINIYDTGGPHVQASEHPGRGDKNPSFGCRRVCDDCPGFARKSCEENFHPLGFSHAIKWH
ncbi:MAG TPA: hypothetical protein VK152_11505 [Paludibacter sp.]|nr:hypothetical protein [Paludibacter sp.]